MEYNTHTAVFHSTSHPGCQKMMFKSCENMTMRAAILCPVVCKSDVKKTKKTRLACGAKASNTIQTNPFLLFSGKCEPTCLHPKEVKFDTKENNNNFICTAIAIKTKWKRQMKICVYFPCCQASVHLWFGSLLMIKWQSPTFDRQLISNHLLCSSQQHSAPDLCKLLFLCKEM